jgi:predicted  nucleic acid-binding Zn-ribbon protein
MGVVIRMSSLSELRQRKKDKEKELKSYKKRLSQVNDIYNNICNSFSDEISTINSKCGSTIENCGYGIIPCANIQVQNDVLNSMKEKPVHSDTNLSEAKDQMSEEQRRVKDKIEKLEEEIENLQKRIDAKIAEEKNSIS